MSKRKTLEDFIKESKKVHGDKYDYSKVEYINTHTKVCIICPEHGEFWQTPSSHLKYGCSKCAKEKISQNRRYTTKVFIEKSKAIYGEKFSYEKTRYYNSRTPVIITCKKHGDFSVLPSLHLNNGKECPICQKNKTIETKKEKELKKQILINKKKLLKEKERKEKENEFIRKSNLIHNNKYDYSKVQYINSTTLVKIICPIHGEFEQMPHNHVKGCECQKCAVEKTRKSLSLTTDEFIKRAKEIHGDKYDYSKVEYGKNNREKVCIICPKHGEFWQEPNMHINEQQGCPLCGTLSSKDENEIFYFLKEILHDKRSRKMLNL